MSMPGIAFLCALAIYVAIGALARNRESDADTKPELTAWVMSVFPFVVVGFTGIRMGRPRGRFTAFMQSALLLIACVLGFQHEAFSRDLVSPLHVGAGLLAGHLVFGASLLATQRSVRETFDHLIDLDALWSFVVENPAVLMQFAGVAVAEEIIYRVGAQPMLLEWTGSPALSILAVALGFSLVHEHFLRNSFGQSAEFLAFAILLGLLYYWTGSLILVIVIHAVRNIEIALLEHWVRADELGSEEAAIRETEFRAGERFLIALVLPTPDLALAWFDYVPSFVPETNAAPELNRPHPCHTGVCL